MVQQVGIQVRRRMQFDWCAGGDRQLAIRIFLRKAFAKLCRSQRDLIQCVVCFSGRSAGCDRVLHAPSQQDPMRYRGQGSQAHTSNDHRVVQSQPRNQRCGPNPTKAFQRPTRGENPAPDRVRDRRQDPVQRAGQQQCQDGGELMDRQHERGANQPDGDQAIPWDQPEDSSDGSPCRDAAWRGVLGCICKEPVGQTPEYWKHDQPASERHSLLSWVANGDHATRSFHRLACQTSETECVACADFSGRVRVEVCWLSSYMRHRVDDGASVFCCSVAPERSNR